MNIDIEAIKRKLLVKYPSFGSIVANMKYIETYDCRDYNGNPTAATDGDTIYYHPEFLSRLTEEEQTFVFAHEICHVAFDHIYRSEDKEPELWNIATDGVINALLKKDGLPLIKGVVDIENADNYNAEELYKKLLKEQEQSNNQNNHSQEKNSNQDSNSSSKQNQTSQENNSSNQSNSWQKGNENQNNTNNNSIEQKDVGHDSHNMWKQAIEKRNQENQNKETSKSSTQDKKQEKSSSFFDKLFNRNKQEENENTQDNNNNLTEEQNKKKEKEEQIKKITEMGEKKAFQQNKIERKKQLQELRDALAQQSTSFGRGTNQELRQIENIGTANPLIDWRKLLKEAVKYNVDWSYANATIEEGVVTPYLEEIPQPETEILLDTSGSINETLLKNFLRECKNILQESKVKVGCFDDMFYGFSEIKNENDIDNMRFVGRGETNFDAAVNAFSRRVENKIIFTDGWADMPSKSIDAIWIVFGGRKIHPKGGKVIYITDEQLKRLSLMTEEYLYQQNGRKR